MQMAHCEGRRVCRDRHILPVINSDSKRARRGHAAKIKLHSYGEAMVAYKQRTNGSQCEEKCFATQALRLNRKRNPNAAVRASRAAAPVEPAFLSVHSALVLVPGTRGHFFVVRCQPLKPE